MDGENSLSTPEYTRTCLCSALHLKLGGSEVMCCSTTLGTVVVLQ